MDESDYIEHGARPRWVKHVFVKREARRASYVAYAVRYDDEVVPVAILPDLQRFVAVHTPQAVTIDWTQMRSEAGIELP